MRFLLRFSLWATVVFVPTWFLHPSWERMIGAAATRLASPPGTEIEMVSLELFFPFDLGIYAALCLASVWAPMAKRLRAFGLGLPALVLLEIVTLTFGIGAMLHARDVDATARLVTGIVRVTGLVTASSAWLLLLGRERLSLAAKTWLGG